MIYGVHENGDLLDICWPHSRYAWSERVGYLAHRFCFHLDFGSV